MGSSRDVDRRRGLIPEASSTSLSDLPAIPLLSEAELQTFRPSLRDQIHKAYEKVQKDPRNADASGRLGTLCHAHKLYSLATAFYERAGFLEPDSFQWTYYLGVVQLALGQESKAFAALDKAVRRRPDYLPARLKLAESLLAAGQWKESRETYEGIVRQHPDSALAYYGLGRVQSARGESESAVRSYLRAVNLSPGFGAAHYALALSYRDLGEREESQEQLFLFQRNRERKPPLQDPLLEAIAALEGGYFHFYQGLKLQAKGQLQEAIAEYNQALRKDPLLWEVHANLILAYSALGQLDKAEEHYQAALKINPGVWETHHSFGLSLRGQGRNPFSADARTSLAEVLAVEGRLDEAEKQCRLAIRNAPNLRLAHFNLGQILRGKGKHAEAISHFHKVLTFEDQYTPLAMYTLANAYVTVGKLPKAIHYFREARQRALSLGQTALVADIDQALKRIQPLEDLK